MKIFLLISIAGFLFSCTSNPASKNIQQSGIALPISDNVKYAKSFYSNKAKWDCLIQSIDKDTFVNRRILPMYKYRKDAPEPIRSIMKDLGVTGLFYFGYFCDSLPGSSARAVIQLDFKTDWDSRFPVHINYAPCPTLESDSGAYFKRDNGNEGWGLGKNYVLWYEHFPIQSEESAVKK